MKRIIFTLIISAAIASSLNAVETVPADEADKIINIIYNKMIPGFKKYSGFNALRTTKLKMTDSISGKLLEDNESVVKIKYNYYSATEPIQVIKYIKNGQEQPVSKFIERKSSQFYPVFDEKGRERYSISITGYKKINEIDCYIFKVIPKQQTQLHFSGNMYFSRKGLDLIANEGSPASLETGVKRFTFYTSYKTIDTMPVGLKTYIEVYIHVPVFFPNKKMALDVEIKDHVLILK